MSTSPDPRPRVNRRSIANRVRHGFSGAVAAYRNSLHEAGTFKGPPDPILANDSWLRKCDRFFRGSPRWLGRGHGTAMFCESTRAAVRFLLMRDPMTGLVSNTLEGDWRDVLKF
jgi:hypothetical protein